MYFMSCMYGTQYGLCRENGKAAVHQDEGILEEPQTPKGEHGVQWNGGAQVKVAVTVLARCSDVSAGKTLEVFRIVYRNPKINHKDECVAVTERLAPLLVGFGLPTEP